MIKHEICSKDFGNTKGITFYLMDCDKQNMAYRIIEFIKNNLTSDIDIQKQNLKIFMEKEYDIRNR